MLTRSVPSIERNTFASQDTAPVLLIQNKPTLILPDTHYDIDGEIASIQIQNTQASGGANVFVNLITWAPGQIAGQAGMPQPGQEFDAADNVALYDYVLVPGAIMPIPTRDAVVGFTTAANVTIAILKVWRRDLTHAPNILPTFG